MYKDKEAKKNVKKYFFINVWRKSVFDIYFTEYGIALTIVYNRFCRDAIYFEKILVSNINFLKDRIRRIF
jgi:hypothetical protein